MINQPVSISSFTGSGKAFLIGPRFSNDDLVIDCICGSRRSDSNDVPDGVCDKCGRNSIVIKSRYEV